MYWISHDNITNFALHRLFTHGQKELIPILAINDKKSVKYSQNSRKNIMLDMRHIDPFFKRSESDRELINSISDKNGIEGNQPHHSFLSLSRLSFLSLLELLGFLMLIIFIGVTLVFWNLILIYYYYYFVKFMFSKGQMKSECINEIIDSPKYHRKNLKDFCPESLFRLGMLYTHLSRIRVALRIIKTNHMYLVNKTFQGWNLSKISSGILENQWFHKYILTLSYL